jgi:hypothetical protein
MDHKYILAFEGSNYPSFDAYVGKYIKHYILPLHLGDYIFAKITGVLEQGSSVVVHMDAGTGVYEQNKMPDAYEAS